MICLRPFLATLCVAFSSLVAAPGPIEPLAIRGADYFTQAGEPVRFWGVNIVAGYYDKAKADAIAANLAALGVNLVRPHHNLRPSRDWNPGMVSGSLLTYENDSREWDPEALDRFDYLNAALRRRGIYLAFSLHGTRAYRAGDVDILKTDDADRRGWMEAIKEIHGWDWRRGFDVRKLLPVVDERAALLNVEFTRKLLEHRNPYTGLTYAEDPQVISIELVNEHSLEYAVICNNRMPAHLQKAFEARWAHYARAAGIEPGDLYAPTNDEQRMLRSRFLNGLDETFFERMKAAARAAGSRAPMTLSNLWRGDAFAEMNQRTADFIENHAYIDPLVVRGIDDGFRSANRMALVDKPYFLGEFNQAEGAANIARHAPHRTMLPVAGAAYGLHAGWSGIVWFAWIHGDGAIGDDGWALDEGRKARLGDMVFDGMMLDHIRTTGMIFRRGLVAPSSKPVVLWAEGPFGAANYQDLMRGAVDHRAGWQSVHAFRRAYGPVPEDQGYAPWMREPAKSPLVSDTGEIVRDVERRQLTVATGQAEAFSGFPDADAPAKLRHLELRAKPGVFATVVAVSEDGQALSQTRRVVISRSAVAEDGGEVADELALRLAGMRSSADGGEGWSFVVTRPRAAAGKRLPVQVDAHGAVRLPLAGWHEGELVLGGK